MGIFKGTRASVSSIDFLTKMSAISRCPKCKGIGFYKYKRVLKRTPLKSKTVTRKCHCLTTR